jgi:hypothetical protein
MDQPDADLTAGPQPATAATAEPSGPPRRVLDPDTRALLTAVLDRLVPPHDDVPGAGDLGVADAIERTLAEDTALRRTFLDGLRAVDVEARGFLGADGELRDEALRRVEAARPAFFAALVNHCYRGFYTHPRVLQHLEATAGYAARPPQPLGHPLPPWRDALLARQRERAPFWRRASPPE